MRPSCLAAGVAIALGVSSAALAQPASPGAGAVPPPPVVAPAPSDQPVPPPVETTAPPPDEAPPEEAPPEIQDIDADPIVTGAPDATVIQSIAQRVGLNVFGDASFVVRSQGKPHSSFELGAIGLIMNAEFTETLSAVNEIAFEFAPGDDGRATPVADLERLQIQYNAKAVHVAGGRLHTELGYWNTAYHHGRWLQLPIERPHVVNFEDDGGLLPIHMVGLEGAYTARTGAGAVRLVGALGNGRGAIEDDVLTLEDTNEMKSVLLKVETIDLGHRDLHLGASVYLDRIAPAGRAQHPTRSINELIGNGFLAYRGANLIAVSELYAVVHDDSDARWVTLAGFGLIGWDLGRYVPFGQVEVRHAASGVDPFYAPLWDPATAAPDAAGELALDLIEATAGVRVDLSEWSVLKFALEIEHLDAETEVNGLANWSFGI